MIKNIQSTPTPGYQPAIKWSSPIIVPFSMYRSWTVLWCIVFVTSNFSPGGREFDSKFLENVKIPPYTLLHPPPTGLTMIDALPMKYILTILYHFFVSSTNIFFAWNLYFSHCHCSWFLIQKRSRYSSPSFGLAKIWRTWQTNTRCPQALWKGMAFLVDWKITLIRDSDHFGDNMKQF